VPALKLKPTSSPSTPQTATSDNSLVTSSNLLHLPKYTGANKPLFEKPLPVTPTFPIGYSYPLTPPEISDNQLLLFDQPQVITSLVTPVAPVPTRPLSLTLANKSNNSSCEILDFTKYNNSRYSCSEIMMMEERLKQMKASNSDIFPPTPGELTSTSSFSGVLAPAKFSSSRQPVLSPDSPNDRFNLHMVTKLDNNNNNNNSNTSNSNNSNCQDTTAEQNKHDANLATPPKRFSFLWRKRKAKPSDEAKMPATPSASKPAAAAAAVDTPTTINTAPTNKNPTAAAESPMHTRSLVDDAYADGGGPSPVVPLLGPELLASLVDHTSSSPSSVLPMPPCSRLDDKSVRKSLSYELDDEVERRASQKAMVSVSNPFTFLYLLFFFILIPVVIISTATINSALVVEYCFPDFFPFDQEVKFKDFSSFAFLYSLLDFYFSLFFGFGVPVLVLVCLGCDLNLRQRTNHPCFFLGLKKLAKGLKSKPTNHCAHPLVGVLDC
jgi:hypothetical protein